MNDQELTCTLQRFGLTALEADLFLQLTRIQRSGSEWVVAPDLAKAVGKDRVRVYQILHKLLKVGLAESRYGRPKKYSAVAPQTAVRRLMAIQETRLTELSYLEKSIVESLLNLSPLTIKTKDDSELDLKQSGVSLVQGIPNIQTTLRKIMGGEDILMIVNDESYVHLTSIMKYLTAKPRSAKILLASTRKRRLVAPRTGVPQDLELQQYPGDLPTILITSKCCALPFYSLELYKAKALSKPVARPRVSDMILTTDSRYVKQMRLLFNRLHKQG